MAAILALVAWLLLGGAALAQRYVFQDLGDLGGGGSMAWGINDAGQVVGSSYLADYSCQAFIWDPKTKVMTGLSDLGGGYKSTAYAIDNFGQVAGSSYSPDFYLNPVLWDAATQTILGSLSVAGDCELLALNDQGRAAGYIFDNSGNQRAFTLDPPYTLNQRQLLPNLGPKPYITAALGINNNGDVVGESQDSSGNLVPFWYHPSTRKMDNLGTLPGWPAAAAFAINNHSQIVGGADTIYYEYGHAFIWDPVNKMQDLDPSSLNGDSAAYAINDAGQVVGSFNLYGYPPSAFLWTPTEGMQDLNSLVMNLPPGTHLDVANGINKTGQIVGSYNFGSGAFLLTVAKPSIAPILQLLLTD